MSKVLIGYGTSEGQTRRIAEYLAELIRGRGHEVELVDLERAGGREPSGYDGVIVGASVHMGKHHGYVRRFVQHHLETLHSRPSAFFSVSLAAQADTDQGRIEARRYIEEFLHRTGWRPGQTGSFAGALLYTHYGFLTRWIMKQIARKKGNPDTDTRRDYRYTDWSQVKRFGEEFTELLAAELNPSLAGIGR